MTTMQITPEISISFDKENENFKRSYENFKTKSNGSEADYLKIVLARCIGLMNGKIENQQLVNYGIEIKGIQKGRHSYLLANRRIMETHFEIIGFHLDYYLDKKYIGSEKVEITEIDREFGYQGRDLRVASADIKIGKTTIKAGKTYQTELMPLCGKIKSQK